MTRLNYQAIHTDYFLWGNLTGIKNNILKKLCIKNYNNRLSDDPGEGKNEDIYIPYTKEVNEVVEKIKDAYFLYSNRKLKLINLWSHVQYKHETSERHDHLDLSDIYSVKESTPEIASCYYVNIPKNGGNLVFDSWPNRYVEKGWMVGAETGKFCMFPAGIQHRVLKNQNTEPRVCIAMNFRLNFKAS